MPIQAPLLAGSAPSGSTGSRKAPQPTPAHVSEIGFVFYSSESLVGG